MINRRGLLAGILGACSAPAFIKLGVLMPVKPLGLVEGFSVTLDGYLTIKAPTSGMALLMEGNRAMLERNRAILENFVLSDAGQIKLWRRIEATANFPAPPAVRW